MNYKALTFHEMWDFRSCLSEGSVLQRYDAALSIPAFSRNFGVPSPLTQRHVTKARNPVLWRFTKSLPFIVIVFCNVTLWSNLFALSGVARFHWRPEEVVTIMDFRKNNFSSHFLVFGRIIQSLFSAENQKFSFKIWIWCPMDSVTHGDETTAPPPLPSAQTCEVKERIAECLVAFITHKFSDNMKQVKLRKLNYG